MAVELIGSVIVLSLSQRLRQHWFAYLALLILIGVLLFGVPMIACFPIGALVALLQHRAGTGDYGGLAEYRAAVARGEREPWDVTPYAAWTLPEMSDTPGIAEMRGATYDPLTRRRSPASTMASSSATPRIIFASTPAPASTSISTAPSAPASAR